MKIGRKILSFFLTLMLVVSTVPSLSFAASAGYADVPSGHWANGVIGKWSGDDYGVLQGNGDGTFAPSRGITLGELATILSKTFGYTERTATEVTPAWADEPVEKAIAAGVIAKTETVDASVSVTREQAVKYIALAYSVAPAFGETTFADNASIGAEYKPYVNAFQKLGYVVGKGNGVFDPKAVYTRAEAMQVIENTTAEIADKSISGQTYGKNLVIRASGVTVKDTTVNSNLIVGQGVGDGEVALDDVKINGSLVVYGGGSNSITVKGGDAVTSTVANKPYGKAVHFNGNFETITVTDGTKVILTGKAARLILLGNNEITLNSGAIVSTVEINGDNVKFNAKGGSTVDSATVNANKVVISGSGTVKNVSATANAKEGVEVLTAPTEIVVDANAGAVKTKNGTVQPGKTATASVVSGGGGGGGGGYAYNPVPDTKPNDPGTAPTGPDNLEDGVIDLGDIEELISDGTVEIIQSDNAAIRMIDGTFTSQPVHSVSDAAAVLNSAAPLFGESFSASEEDIVLQSIDSGLDSEEHFYRYTPTVEGIPVLGGQMVLVADGNGVVQSLFSSYDSRISDVDTTPTISEDTATGAAISALLSDAEITQFLGKVVSSSSVAPDAAAAAFKATLTTSGALMIYAVLEDEVPVLAYAITVRTALGSADGDVPVNPSLPVLPYIDMTYYIYANGAQAGEVFNTISNLQGAEAAVDLKGEPRPINTEDGQLRDELRKIETYKTKYGGALWLTPELPGDLVSKDNDTWDPAAVSAHANMAAVYDYYQGVLGRQSFDGQGATIKVSIDFDANAWLPGDYENACWDGTQIVFGNGKLYQACLDVVGHEFTHAVIENVIILPIGGGNSIRGLIYQGEPGALNESYADILGSLIEGKTDANKWLIAEDTEDNVAIRDMANPQQYDQPEHYDGRYDGTEDNGGVHKNSGIFNFAAYKMITDSRTSSISNATWAKVFYRSLFRLTNTDTFLGARGAVISTAKSLGFDQTQQQAIKDAFDAVGIVEPNGIRIVLKWGAQPYDLDSHLVGPTVSGSGDFHIYYSQRNYYENGNYFSESSKYAADLDYDDTTSYGPEVTTIRRLTPGDYSFYVHDYTNRSASSSTALANSGAEVKVYRGTSATPLASYNVLSSSSGTLWNVFKLTISDSGGVSISPTDTYTYHSDVDSIGN
ncbi:MAG: M4 family metallopeptidase [Clostridiales Family XIII bacterium]|jgi:Zn-dependent metalloprotease|nr:M4 family metallopeptidase [Clostridiales Family XIII bacterium]